VTVKTDTVSIFHSFNLSQFQYFTVSILTEVNGYTIEQWYTERASVLIQYTTCTRTHGF